jgi:hypothetical protein
VRTKNKEGNAEETKHMFMSIEEDAGRNQTQRTMINPLKKVAKFKCLGGKQTKLHAIRILCYSYRVCSYN